MALEPEELLSTKKMIYKKISMLLKRSPAVEGVWARFRTDLSSFITGGAHLGSTSTTGDECVIDSEVAEIEESEK